VIDGGDRRAIGADAEERLMTKAFGPAIAGGKIPGEAQHDHQ